MIGPLTRFGAPDTALWFRDRGVELKTEPDGRMFPVTDDSETVIGCLMGAAQRAGVALRTACGLRALDPMGGRFVATLASGERLEADRVLIATGGTRGSAGTEIARALGHAVEAAVPSLFTFHVADPRIAGLSGVAVDGVASVAGRKLSAAGPLLITHWGLSGPAILRLSAWGARELHGLGYRFGLTVNWAQGRPAETAKAELEAARLAHPKRLVSTQSPVGVPSRLWERLVTGAGIPASATWSGLSNESLRVLSLQATSCEFQVSGKSMNKEEFVTCGGVSLAEVDMSTMESRVAPGLYFAGEVLDIDGITGGYNLQAAWTTGWQAGRAMALS
jgi:hypothetical protein